VSARILEAFDTLTALNIVDNLSDSIIFEARKTSGSEYMYGLIHAVKNSQLVKIVYQKFTEESASIRELEPYALKEHMNRWYLMAVDRKDNRLKSFAFDRIHDLVPTNVRFSKNDDINVEEIYQDCFGIINPNGNPKEEVILSFTAHQGKYIKTLPLHHSQELIQETENEMVFKLNIVITEDFVMELLSHSNRVEVLQPDHLKDRLLWHYNKAIELYS
jgi:predicted DNA-binding transcriptional regulator YafY